MTIPDVRKIAVLRANAIGDFFFVLPALEALRAAYPSAEIVYLGQPWHAGFLAGRPGPVDRMIIVPPSNGVRQDSEWERRGEDPAELERFFAEMRREQFDLALQLHGGGQNSNPFLLRLGARVTAGLKAPDAPPLDRWMPYLYWQHEVLRYLEAVALVGAVPVRLEARLELTARDMRESWEVVPETAAPLVLLHPGAGDPRRRWPPDKFAAVGDRLAEAGARVVVTGVASEREVVKQVVRLMQSEGVNLAGKLSLEAMAGLLSRCRVVVSNDTGPLHMAAAVGTPTVGIYWAGNLINAGPLTRTHHRPQLSWRLHCPICGRHCMTDSCQHQASFVGDVPVEAVRDAALELLQGTARPLVR